jgi:hypothetical protein
VCSLMLCSLLPPGSQTLIWERRARNYGVTLSSYRGEEQTQGHKSFFWLPFSVSHSLLPSLKVPAYRPCICLQCC